MSVEPHSPQLEGIGDTKPIRFVGLEKLEKLLRPGHPWFRPSWGTILDWRLYQCDQFPKPIFAYPHLSNLTSARNPYKLSVKASQSALKSLRSLRTVVAGRKLENVSVLDFVFTFPAEMTAWFAGAGDDTRAGEKLAWALWRRFWNRERGSGAARLGCHANLHIWSTKDPSKPHWHFHVLMVNQAFDGSKFINVKAYKKADDISALKRRWKDTLLEFAGKHDVKVSSLKGKALPVVYYQYIPWGNQAKIVHKFQYVSRSPIEDFAIYSNANTKCDDPPDWLIYYTNRARCYGWFREFGKIIGRGDYRALQSSTDKVCPICGDDLMPAGLLAAADIRTMADRGCRLFATEWVAGGLQHVPLSDFKLKFICEATV